MPALQENGIEQGLTSVPFRTLLADIIKYSDKGGMSK
jgi:hypothetical protein